MADDNHYNNHNSRKAVLDEPGKRAAQRWPAGAVSHPMVMYRLHHLAWQVKNGLRPGEW